MRTLGSEREVGKDEYHEVRALRRERGPRSGNYNPVGRAKKSNDPLGHFIFFCNPWMRTNATQRAQSAQQANPAPRQVLFILLLIIISIHSQVLSELLKTTFYKIFLILKIQARFLKGKKFWFY